MNKVFTFLCLIVILISLVGHIPEINDSIKDSETKNLRFVRNTIKKLQGYWVLDTDSLAYLTVRNRKLSFRLAWVPSDREHKYKISNTKSGSDPNEVFLMLTNKFDTMKYQIIGLTEQKMDLMYYPSRNIYSYRKIKSKLKYDVSTKVNRYSNL